jgi:hypothetical protein
MSRFGPPVTASAPEPPTEADPEFARAAAAAAKAAEATAQAAAAEFAKEAKRLYFSNVPAGSNLVSVCACCWLFAWSKDAPYSCGRGAGRVCAPGTSQCRRVRACLLLAAVLVTLQVMLLYTVNSALASKGLIPAGSTVAVGGQITPGSGFAFVEFINADVRAPCQRAGSARLCVHVCPCVWLSSGVCGGGGGGVAWRRWWWWCRRRRRPSRWRTSSSMGSR